MLVVFIVMYFTMFLTALNGVALEELGRPIIFLMSFFPLLGIITGTRIGGKGYNQFIKGRTEAPYAFLVNESRKELWQQINNDID